MCVLYSTSTTGPIWNKLRPNWNKLNIDRYLNLLHNKK